MLTFRWKLRNKMCRNFGIKPFFHKLYVAISIIPETCLEVESILHTLADGSVSGVIVSGYEVFCSWSKSQGLKSQFGRTLGVQAFLLEVDFF